MLRATQTSSSERVRRASEIVDRILASESFSDEYYSRVAEHLAERFLGIRIKAIAPRKKRRWWAFVTRCLARWKSASC
jgi:hypothetical protein